MKSEIRAPGSAAVPKLGWNSLYEYVLASDSRHAGKAAGFRSSKKESKWTFLVPTGRRSVTPNSNTWENWQPTPDGFGAPNTTETPDFLGTTPPTNERMERDGMGPSLVLAGGFWPWIYGKHRSPLASIGRHRHEPDFRAISYWWKGNLGGFRSLWIGCLRCFLLQNS